MNPIFRLAHILDDQEDGFFPDFIEDRGFRSTRLETAVFESEEVAAVADFLETRVIRKVKSSVVGTGLRALASNPYRFVRFGAKGALRMVPVVGWVMLAYDLYGLGDDLEIY